MITAQDVTRHRQAGRLRLAMQVSGTPHESLWFDLPEEHEGLVTDRLDPFAVALLLPAMRSAQSLHLTGTVTDELLYRLNGPVQEWVCSVLPNYTRVTITATDEQPPTTRPAGVASGFSAGIDSYGVMGDYLLADNVPPSLRITHLLFNNVGSHSTGAAALAAARLAAARRVVAEWGVPVVDVNSNLGDHLVPLGVNTAFQNTHSIRNATVPHLLSRGIGTWFYASALAFEDIHGGRSEDIGHTDVIGLPLLSTASLSLTSVGSERTRVQKTVQVADLVGARAGLDVCIDPDPARERNCSSCWKCLRTLLTLDIAGKLDEFCPARFDRDVYLEHRTGYMATVLASSDPLHREIVEFAGQSHFRWPPQAKCAAQLQRVKMAAVHRRFPPNNWHRPHDRRWSQWGATIA